MNDLLAILALLLSALSFIVAIVGLILVVKLNKGIHVNVSMPPPPQPAQAAPDQMTELLARITQLQQVADKQFDERSRDDKTPSYDALLGELNKIMLGGIDE